MGYESQVVITLEGEKSCVQDVLNAYKLSESGEEIAKKWHPLITDVANPQVEFFYEEWQGESIFYDGTANVQGPMWVQLVWKFSWVKFSYCNDVVDRLGGIVGVMRDRKMPHADQLALKFIRIGEDEEDVQRAEWGDNDMENCVHYHRDLEVETTKCDVNPALRVFQK